MEAEWEPHRLRSDERARLSPRYPPSSCA